MPYLAIIEAVYILGNTWVPPPPIGHGLLEGHVVNIFEDATVQGKAVEYVARGGTFL